MTWRKAHRHYRRLPAKQGKGRGYATGAGRGSARRGLRTTTHTNTITNTTTNTATYRKYQLWAAVQHVSNDWLIHV